MNTVTHSYGTSTVVTQCYVLKTDSRQTVVMKSVNFSSLLIVTNLMFRLQAVQNGSSNAQTIFGNRLRPVFLKFPTSFFL